MKRINVLKQVAFEEKGFDGFAIFNQANLLYLTNNPASSVLVIPRDGQSTIYAFEVNYEQAKAEAKDFTIECVKRKKDLMKKILETIKERKIKKLAVDSLNVELWNSLIKTTSGITLPEIGGNLITRLRKVKDNEEIALMRKAGELTSIGMKTALELLKPGMKEYELAAEIEYAMRKRGSYGTAFHTIVASGSFSAFPHGNCGGRVIREGDLVVVDIGATYKFYHSDMTRTLVAGNPSEKQKRLYAIVKASQEAASELIKAKARAKEVDYAARKVIEDAGYGRNFVHGLGHGVGLEVHEPPILNVFSEETLEIGNVVTNEPGIYLVGYGGIRIEDTVLVKENRAEKLTHCIYGLNTRPVQH